MPEQLLQFLQALWNALQSFAQNAVEEENIRLYQFGAIVYVLLCRGGLGGPLGFVACISMTFAIRIASVRFNISSS